MGGGGPLDEKRGRGLRPTWHLWVQMLLVFALLMAVGNVGSWRWWAVLVLGNLLNLVGFLQGLRRGREMMREVWGNNGEEYKKYAGN